MTVDFFAVGNHGVNLVSETHVLSLLGNQIVLSEYKI